MTAAAASQSGCSATTPGAPGARLNIRWRRPLLGTLGSRAAATVASVAAFAAVVGGGASVASAATRDWIATGWNIHLADQADPATARHFFNTSSSFGTGPKASI